MRQKNDIVAIQWLYQREDRDRWYQTILQILSWGIMRCKFSWDWQIILRTRLQFLSLRYPLWEHHPNTAPALNVANLWLELAELKIYLNILGFTYCPVCVFWKDATMAITVNTLFLRIISFLNEYIPSYLIKRVNISTLWNPCDFYSTFSNRVYKFVWNSLQPSVSTIPVVYYAPVNDNSVIWYSCVLHWKRYYLWARSGCLSETSLRRIKVGLNTYALNECSILTPRRLGLYWSLVNQSDSKVTSARHPNLESDVTTGKAFSVRSICIGF